MSSEILEPDCDPIRVWALGQSFVVFRDSAGKVGLLDEACPHRKASLVFGRNERGGIRCLWHGWKMAVDGSLIEVPNYPDCKFQKRVKANSYEAVESGGFVWGYFGPADAKPALPELSWASLPPENVLIVPVDFDCNFVKPLEGLVDSSHVSLLHSDTVRKMSGSQNIDFRVMGGDVSPKLELELTDFGFHYAALRDPKNSTSGQTHVRVTAYLAPYCVFIPGAHAHFSVPQDDTHCRFYNIFWNPNERLDAGHARKTLIERFGLSGEELLRQGIQAQMPDVGPLGKRNTFTQDREAMRTGQSFAGKVGLTAEDALMTASIPGICDYEGEHLVPSDIAIVRLRRLLHEIARQVANGQNPSSLAPETPFAEISAVSGILDSNRWQDLVPAHRTLS